ncbi:MAG: ATPase, partial [Alphaproteobacteria bacterium]|nr:ATPase [Alphaproteobacteria bacterium]
MASLTLEQVHERQEEIGLWPDEPLRITAQHVDDLLIWCVLKRANDITIQTDRQVYIEVDGFIYAIMRRPIDSADMENIIVKIYGPDAMAKLAAGKDLDLSYEIRADRNTRYRFRVNITAILSRGRDSVQITLRSLPNLPPTMLDLGVEQKIIDNWSPPQGMVL